MQKVFVLDLSVSKGFVSPVWGQQPKLGQWQSKNGRGRGGSGL